jgi:hypothetical protein
VKNTGCEVHHYEYLKNIQEKLFRNLRTIDMCNAIGFATTDLYLP